jgi:hypothetical protein
MRKLTREAGRVPAIFESTGPAGGTQARRLQSGNEQILRTVKLVVVLIRVAAWAETSLGFGEREEEREWLWIFVTDRLNNPLVPGSNPGGPIEHRTP